MMTENELKNLSRLGLMLNLLGAACFAAGYFYFLGPAAAYAFIGAISFFSAGSLILRYVGARRREKDLSKKLYK
jgi:NADH:ubiquinone oxidoreductase subunit 5 (subunit L)/multisubunit Na+/H+ antiporter MnhA subunit